MKQPVPTQDIKWEVLPPKRRESSLGSVKPKATLIISTQDKGEERLYIPARVGKLLSAKKKAHEINPSSRAELLYALKTLSTTCAQTRLAEMVNKRDYSSSEATQKLRLDGYTSEICSQVVDYAQEVGLIDNKRFADAFIRSKLGVGWGQRKIERALKDRGIDCSQVAGWPYDYLDPDDEYGRARELAAHKYFSEKNKMQKIARFLIGRGFPTSVAFGVAKEICSE